MAESNPFWWHSIDLGEGVVTKGHKTPALLQAEVAAQQYPDLRDKTVLDVGAWDGFFSFEAERRGAKRVVALDLPGRPGFDIAHTALQSRVERVVGDFTEIDLADLGTFDVVLFLGVLYHMQNPLQALQRVAAVTREIAIIETAAIVIPGLEDLAICEFYETDELCADTSNWWAPNKKAVEGLCRAAGFSRAKVLSSWPDERTIKRRPKIRLHRCRVTVHAWK
jgi:tRNA (mo5U34)-methyltransferase